MEKEKKDLSFILILLSTLIGIDVLFQWLKRQDMKNRQLSDRYRCIIPVGYSKRFVCSGQESGHVGKTAGKGNHVPFPVCDTHRRISFSFSI